MSTPENLMADIRRLLQEGRYADAASACREALAEAPDSPDLRMLMGLCEEAAGQLDKGRAWMEKALEKDPGHTAAGFHHGRLLLIEGKDEAARDAFERCIATDPNHAAARTLLARIEQRAGRTEQAIEGLRTALRADEAHAPAHAALAMLLLRGGQLEEAHGHAARAVQLRPEDALSQITMAQIFQAQGHHDFAEQCLRNALDKAPDHPQLRDALAQFSRVRQAGGDADDEEGLVARMRAHYRSGQLRPAAELAQALQFRLAADQPALLEVAEVLMDAGAVEASEELLNRADQSLQRLPLSRARLLAVRGEIDPAVKALGALFDHASSELSHDARRLAADLHLRQGRLDEALAVLEPLLTRSDLPPATARMIAQLEHAGGETANARKVLDALLARAGLHDAELAVTHNLMGRILDESGAFEAAGRHLAQGGWRAPFMLAELEQVSPPALVAAWSAPDAWSGPATPPDDGRRSPLFVAGWPGSGREALLPALLSAGQFALLPGNELDRRRELLGLPATPDALRHLSDSALRLTRKRYLRGAGEAPNGPLEPGLPEVTALPVLARFFPGARVIWLVGTEPALKLHWRLAGCREIEKMAERWRQEQELYAQLRSILPLEFIEIDCEADLLAEPQTCAKTLAQRLEIDNVAALVEALTQSLRQAAYRPAGHWRHYPSLV